MVLKVVALGVAGACLASFALARGRRFVGEPSRRMRVMVGIGMAVSALQLGWLALMPETPWLAMALVGYGGALLIFWWAFCSHTRRHFALAFAEESPEILLTTGPYRLVRHPYYLSYLLFWGAGALGSASPWLWGAVALMVGLYRAAADHEERQYASGPMAAEYARYRARTGRFVPWLGRG